MSIFSRIFGTVDRTYLIRAYCIGIAFFALMMFFATRGTWHTSNYSGVAIYAVSTLLFPFSKLVWDTLFGAALGNNLIIMNALVLFLIKFFINGMLWGFAILIAPLGIGYLLYRSR